MTARALAQTADTFESITVEVSGNVIHGRRYEIGRASC